MKTPDLDYFRSIWYATDQVCLWWVILPDGRLHIRAELVSVKSLISTFAREIRLKTAALKMPSVRYTVGLTEQLIGSSSKGDDGETRLDTFRLSGLSVRESSHDPVQGWSRVSELFGLRSDGRPWLTIDPSCTQLQRAITNAVSDPANPESVLDFASTPPLHALRIGAMSRPAPRPFKKPDLPKNAVGHLLRELQNANRSPGRLVWR